MAARIVWIGGFIRFCARLRRVREADQTGIRAQRQEPTHGRNQNHSGNAPFDGSTAPALPFRSRLRLDRIPDRCAGGRLRSRRGSLRRPNLRRYRLLRPRLRLRWLLRRAALRRICLRRALRLRRHLRRLWSEPPRCRHARRSRLHTTIHWLRRSSWTRTARRTVVRIPPAHPACPAWTPRPTSSSERPS